MLEPHKSCTEQADIEVKDRVAKYGPPSDHFKHVAAVWSAYLGFQIEPYQVPLMQAQLKMCRESTSHLTDNLVDICGYTLCSELVIEGSLPVE